MVSNSMKLDKSIVQRRIDLMAAEGIVSPRVIFLAPLLYVLTYVPRNLLPMHTWVLMSMQNNYAPKTTPWLFVLEQHGLGTLRFLTEMPMESISLWNSYKLVFFSLLNVVRY